jgi:hypothetical protein
MIAISYRREDSSPVTGRLYDRLRAEFGRGNVFIDFESIAFGVDFRDKIKHTLERARVVIAVIGPSWAGSRHAGKRRIDDPTDFVRMEIAAALQRGIPVIPVLLDNTVMPSVEDLPEELRAFAYRNALVLNTGVDFHHHADRLIAGIHELVDGGPPGKRKGRPFTRGVIVGLALIGALIASASLWKSIQGPRVGRDQRLRDLARASLAQPGGHPRANGVSSPPKPRMGPLQYGWNYPHNDIKADGWLSIGSAEACADLCYEQPECKAMTYVISNKSCWLKYAVPDRTQNRDMISAVKQESN